MRQQGEAGFAMFLGAVQQVVEGADPARVRVELEEPFAEAWRRLRQRIVADKRMVEMLYLLIR